MICEHCSRMGKKLNDSLSFKEKIMLMSAMAVMVRSVESSATAKAEDRMVANSVVTKLLSSFDDAPRDAVLGYFRQASGVGITLKDCPHGILDAVTPTH